MLLDLVNRMSSERKVKKNFIEISSLIEKKNVDIQV